MEIRPSNPTSANESPSVTQLALLHKGWHSRGYLPHCDVIGKTQGVTFRLVDSVPNEVVQAWKRELDWIEEPVADGAMTFEAQREELHRRLSCYEDAGYGACHLRQPAVARMVVDTLLHFHGARYELKAWCVMPNHVHVLIQPEIGWPLSGIMQSIKRHAARQANRLLGRRGSFWAPDYYDRYIRDEAHFNKALDYIHQNPVKAKLCVNAHDWRWSSASACSVLA